MAGRGQPKKFHKKIGISISKTVLKSAKAHANATGRTLSGFFDVAARELIEKESKPKE